MENEDRWGGHASTYDRVFAPLTGAIARAMFTLCEGRLGPDARVLDIACGSGALLLPALDWAARQRAGGGAATVVGTDFSPGMVALASRHARRSHPAALYRCDVQDGQALGYADGAFDGVFSCFGIFLFEDRHAGWREAARVLRPGGVFATTTWMAPEHNEMFRAQFGPVMDALPAHVRDAHVDPDAGPPGWMVVADPAVLRAEVEAAGLSDVAVHPFHTMLALSGVDDAWRAMQDSPVAGAMIQACDARERSVLREALVAGLAPYTTPDGAVLLRAACHILTARR